MKVFKCHCGWTYILGKKKFYGPLYEDGSNEPMGKMRPLADFIEGYGHCYTDYLKRGGKI